MALTYNDLMVQSKGNTGSVPGYVPEKIVAFMLASKAFALTAANMAADNTLIGVLQVASTAVVSGRVYPFIGADAIVDLTDNTAEAGLDEAGYGNLMGVNIKKHSFTARIGNISQTLNQNLFKYNSNKDVAICLIDAKGRLLMKQNGTGAKFMPCQIVTDQTKMPTGSTSAVQNVKIILDETDALMGDKLVVYPFSQTTLGANALSDLMSGISDVELTLISATTTAITVKAIRKADLRNMADADMFATAAAAAGAWKVILDSTGAAITPSGVTVSALGYFVIAGTFTTAPHSVSMETAAALKALTIGSATTGGYESNVLTVTPA